MNSGGPGFFTFVRDETVGAHDVVASKPSYEPGHGIQWETTLLEVATS